MMIISKIEIFPLRIPLKRGSRSDAAAWGDKDLPAADSLLVKVTTDQGLDGWGEAFGFRAVLSAKGDRRANRAALHRPGRYADFASHARNPEKAARVRAGRALDLWPLRGGHRPLWDIAGKAANTPVYRLLGGGGTDLACYASLVRYSDPGLVRANARRAIDAGFHSLKLHEIELSAIRAAREEAGLEVELMLDVNCPWTLTEARARAEELEEIRLKWLEEPLWPPENYDGLAELRKTCGIPIAAGENVPTLMDF